MYNHVSQMEPLYLARSESLEDPAREVVAASAKRVMREDSEALGKLSE